VVELREVRVTPLDPSRLRAVIGDRRYQNLLTRAEDFQVWLGGTKIWNINSTATGGGVAEMLQVLVGYCLGLGLDVRWLVMHGDPDFFTITKRLHNRIHGAQGDQGSLGEAEAEHYRDVTIANSRALLKRVRRGDVAILHDPQAAGLAPVLREAGLRVVWRSHIGADHRNAWTDQAWDFLRPHIEAAAALVFTRAAYAPKDVPAEKVVVIPPSIDPLSPKNQDISSRSREHVLERIGILGPASSSSANFTRLDGTIGEVVHTASVVSEGPRLDGTVPLVVQVSRWDRLKDMPGVMRGFAATIAEGVEADLALVGPSVEGVADDPEGSEVWAECVSVWENLPDAIRRRIRLISLPMNDVDENAVMVNAVQRQATVIVQKSLVEGFGLTVAEGMWKGKAVVASAVGGIVDQIGPGTGILLEDPADLGAFGRALGALLRDVARIEQLGRAARSYVQENFVGDLHLLRYAALIEGLVAH
jgi:trehalose synthase